jgi:hypothetical protein
MAFGLALALLQLVQINAALAVTMDDFNDNEKSVIWTNEKAGTGVYVTEKNKRVEFTISPSATGVAPYGQFFAEFRSRFQLRQDFDVIINFNAITWPLQSGVSVGIGLSVDPNTPVCGLSRTSLTSGEFIAFTNASTKTVVDSFPTVAAAGKLRLKRVGKTLTAYCSVPESSSQWHELKSLTLQSAPPLTLDLVSGSSDKVFSNQKVVAALDNFILNKGYLLWPPVE